MVLADKSESSPDLMYKPEAKRPVTELTTPRIGAQAVDADVNSSMASIRSRGRLSSTRKGGSEHGNTLLPPMS